MKFLKQNSYDIVRLLLNQFALAVFGVVLTTAARMRADGGFDWLTLVVSIFSALFYLYILYATLLEMGGKHKVKIDSGSMPGDRHLGVKLMLIAQIPNFLVLFLMLLGWIFGHAVAGNSFFIGLFGITQMIMYFLQSMYDGIIGAIIPNASGTLDYFFVWLSYLISVLPAILVAWGSYILGLKEKKIFFKKPPTSEH